MGGDNSSDITALVKAAYPHFAAAGLPFIGPATAGIDMTYLTQSFQDGILDSLSAVSVHAYRNTAPGPSCV